MDRLTVPEMQVERADRKLGGHLALALGYLWVAMEKQFAPGRLVVVHSQA